MLTLMYIAFAVLGCGYVLISALMGHLDFSDGGAGGHDSGASTAESHYGIDGQGHGATSTDAAGPGDFHFPFFSPLAIATLLACVGGYGLIAQHGFGASDAASLLVALPAALATAYGVTWVGWKLASGSRASSVIRLSRLQGAPAEVTVPIPAGGVGEAVVMIDGQRFPSPAREAGGREVPRGALVTVVGVGPTLTVAVRAREEGSLQA